VRAVHPLVRRYRDARPDASGDVGAALTDAVDRARAAWPMIDAEAMVDALASLPPAIDALSEERIDELALALACAAGSDPALRHMEREYFPVVERALRRMKLDDAIADEVAQEVRRKLLVADGGPPRIVGYAGRGSLRGLLKVTATRTALSLLRKEGRVAPGDEPVLDVEGEDDPELGFLKERYRGVFRSAFEEAVQNLTARERNLLRLHFLRKVTLEALASMYGVHRATIVRHLAKIRDDLDRATRKGLQEQLGAERREVESVMDLIQSRLDASVERMLRTMEE